MRRMHKIPKDDIVMNSTATAKERSARKRAINMPQISSLSLYVVKISTTRMTDFMARTAKTAGNMIINNIMSSFWFGKYLGRSSSVSSSRSTNNQWATPESAMTPKLNGSDTSSSLWSMKARFLMLRPQPTEMEPSSRSTEIQISRNTLASTVSQDKHTDGPATLRRIMLCVFPSTTSYDGPGMSSTRPKPTSLGKSATLASQSALTLSRMYFTEPFVKIAPFCNGA
mmetsp:Transcript_8314/g.21073  ORF Transcript_8314/g.21073 Transcript_8314/m.21073 type:complete len:227 (+) Transcript_8314:858-1538(+)